MHSENADCIRPLDKTTAAEENRAAKAVCSMNTARRQDKRTAVLGKGRIRMQTSSLRHTTGRGWGESICHTLFWKGRKSNSGENARHRTGYPAGWPNQERPLLWNVFIPDRTDRKNGNTQEMTGWKSETGFQLRFICRALKNLCCYYVLYLKPLYLLLRYEAEHRGKKIRCICSTAGISVCRRCGMHLKCLYVTLRCKSEN